MTEPCARFFYACNTSIKVTISTIINVIVKALSKIIIKFN
ncbi:hypothetical protein CPS_3962 [Colwellia psychrerythraea 34H]|uniref:Uncharacterized protein n=1 Tax=Colwellia psychrerythraea (strain 34H / ATCC BAA-681) TaxID=167879 RepID=Q47X50_COLP3|nr:hypothetical protein CPS_3962 [Colwellia psychrerythraea 34H]